MRKFWLILFFLLSGTISSLCQFNVANLNIDSLKKVLHSLRDSARVDCLNELSWNYFLKRSPDSACLYATLAKNEALAINYSRGVAASEINIGSAEEIRFDFASAEKHFRKAIVLYEKTNDILGLGLSHEFLACELHEQSRFPEAILEFEKAIPYLNKSAREEEVAQAYVILSGIYREKGDFDIGFEYAQKQYAILKKLDHYTGLCDYLSNMGGFYKEVDDYETALDYYRQSIQLVNIHDTFNLDGIHTVIGETFNLLHQYDSALYYLLKVLNNYPDENKYVRMGIGETYLLQSKYDIALSHFMAALDAYRNNYYPAALMRILLDLAKANLGKNNDWAALRFSREGLALAQQRGARLFMREGYQTLSEVYDHLGKTDSAYFYHKMYTSLKDSIVNNKIRGRLIAYKSEQKIELLKMEKEMQQAKLKKQAALKNTLIIGILAFLLVSIFIFRNIMLKRKNEKHQKEIAEAELKLQKLESQKIKAEFQHQSQELEMQALRAQMNPHFVFNSLNSINRFILQNNKNKASEYLTKFSRLIRLILQNSQTSLITLENELEASKLYLELEAVRFDHQFSFTIKVENDLDISSLKVPPLIIQPYAENAIWHGLMHKEENGQLDIEINQENDQLFFKITDNGIGRKKAAELASKSATRHKSMGSKITANRIATLNPLNGNGSSVTINDLVNADGSAAGTEVIIKIPVIYD